MTRAILVCAVLCGGCLSNVVQAPHRFEHIAEEGDVERGVRTFEGERGTWIVERWGRPSHGARAIVVVSHGLKDYGERYQELARVLIPRGYAVYLPDHRGHGRSDGPRSYVDDFEDYVRDLDQVVHDARRRDPERAVYLVGHSMGGAIATRYALEHPTLVRGLVLTGPALATDADWITIAFADMASVLTPGLDGFSLADRDFSRDPAVVEAMGRDPLVHHGAVPVRTASQLLGTMGWIRARATQLRAPLLAVHGTADRVTVPRGSREIVDHAGSQDATLWLCEGLYHDVWHEPEGPGIREAIANWIDAHVAGTADAVEAPEGCAAEVERRP